MLTFRRHYLDKLLSETKFSGRVLDAGGSRNNRRGEFEPPLEQVEQWVFLNTDPSVVPDIISDVQSMALKDASFDTILLAEVLEHVENPGAVLRECHRVLGRDGVLVLTMPFLFPLHPDPNDFQRWTPDKIRIELETLGFSVRRIEPMGGTFAVLHDIFRYGLVRSPYRQRLLNRLMWRFGLPLIQMAVKIVDQRLLKNDFSTTGFYVSARKN